MEWLLNAVNALANAALAILPDSPFPSIAGKLSSDALSTLNWVIGVGAMVDVLSAWLTAVALFYVVRVILAWAKVIGS